MTTEAPVESAGAELPERRRRFVEEYLVDGNATRAALEAGYSEHTAGTQGRWLLQNVAVVRAITDAQAKRTEGVQLRAEDVERGVLEIANDAEQNGGVRISAWGLLSKRTGGFVERSEVEHTGEVTIQRNTPDLR